MDMLEAIYKRRSIRRFKNQEVPRELLEKVMEATMQAPSGKNRQPWSFVVLEGQKKNQLVDVLENQIENLKKHKIKTGTSGNTAKCMRQAPVLILIFNTGVQKNSLFNISSNYMRLVDLQSIGGAIQTMLLAAEELGLGTLWICDVFYGDKALCKFVNKTEELIAAVSIGYANESPNARPRKAWQEVTEWMK